MAKTKKNSPITAEQLAKKHESVLAKYFGCVEDVDRIELDRYCRLIEKIEQLRSDMDGREVIYEGGKYRPNPMLPVIKEYEYQAAMIANRLGLHLATRQSSLLKMKRFNKPDRPPKVEKKEEPDLDFEATLGSEIDVPDPE